MTRATRPRRQRLAFSPLFPALGPLAASALGAALGVCLIAWTSAPVVCRADEGPAPEKPEKVSEKSPDKATTPDEKPDAKPDLKSDAKPDSKTDVHPVPTTQPVKVHAEGGDGGLLHPISPTTGPAVPTTGPAAPTTGPSTQPATQPTTKPTIPVSPAARAELDALRDAYKALHSLHLAGTITADLDINGEQKTGKGTLEADYQAHADAAPTFRQVTHDAEDGDAKGAAAQGADVKAGDAPGTVVGSTGEKLYYFDPEFQQYRSTAAPKKKFATGKMPRPYYSLLAEQDPSLLLAVVDDAAAEVLDGLTSIEKVEDAKVGEDTCAVLRLVDSAGDTIDLQIDPKTHLLRRVVSDQVKSLKKSGKQDVKRALVTIDYTESAPDAPVKAEQFAWAPPAGAHEVTVVAEGPPDISMGPDGQSEPANALEKKPAPDFKLKDMNGKEVSLSEFKGSVVVLDFWATWCGPCRASLPHINKLYEDKKGAGLKVFAVDLREDPDDVQQGIKEMKLTLPVLLDSDGKVAESYLVNGIPQTVVVGKDGVVRKVFVGAGPDSAERLHKVVEEAMK